MSISSFKMKKLLLKLSLVVMASCAVVVAVVLHDTLKALEESEQAYSATSVRDVLVVGSSQEGCSIVESERFKSKVLWVSQTVPASYLSRLFELERRGALGGVKTLIVYFNDQVYRLYSDNEIKFAMSIELPLSWRYCDVYGVSRMRLLGYMMQNLRFPLNIRLAERAPDERPSVVKKCKKDFVKFESDTARSAKSFVAPVHRDERIRRLSEVYARMKEVCDRHHIQMIVVDYPSYPVFEDMQPEFVKKDVETVYRNMKAMGITCHVARRYPKSFYCDYVHMTRTAADQFTRDLWEDLGL